MSLNAAEVLANLSRLGHDYSPEKQAYKASIAGQNTTIYDPNSLADDGLPAIVTVRASEVDKYVAKGFLTERPVAATAPAGKKGK